MLGDIAGGLNWLDYRELWQVFAAVFIVGGTLFGAFCLSSFTPTVGLGCRSGGYTIFAILAFTLILAEMVSWWIMDACKERFTRWLDRRRQRRNAEISRRDAAAMQRAAARRSRIELCSDAILFFPKALFDLLERALPASVIERPDRLVRRWQETSPPDKFQNALLRPLEITNSIWLVCVTFVQRS